MGSRHSHWNLFSQNRKGKQSKDGMVGQSDEKLHFKGQPDGQLLFQSYIFTSHLSMSKVSNIPLPTLPYIYSPFGAGGAVGWQPTSESNFLSLFRYETHLPTPGSTVSCFFLSQKKFH